MNEYMAEMENGQEGIRVGIQPDMMKLYSDAGYKIVKVEYVEVTDVEAELANLESNEVTGSVGGVTGERESN